MILKGKRVYLKLLEQGELPAVHAILCTPGVIENLMWNHADLLLAHLPTLLTGDAPTSRAFGIWALDVNRLIGVVTLNKYLPVPRSAVVGMFAIHPSAAALRAAEDAFRVLAVYCADTLNLNRVGFYCWDGNRISETLYRRIGAVPEGRLRAETFKGGKYVDKLLYSMLREDFEKWRATWH